MSLADDARISVSRSRKAQGLPEKVTDPGALARVVAVLLTANGNGAPKGAATTITTTTTCGKSRCLDGS